MSDEPRIVELLRARAIPPDAAYQPEVYLSRGARGPRAVTTWTGPIEIPAELRARADTVWVAFIDLMPAANFEHPVRYAFLIPGSGEMTVVDATTPPVDLATHFEKLDLGR